jgi:LytS/YehU family sensor histidine kinase
VPALIGSPTPWQWSGDEQPRANWWRGSLQCLAYVTVWGFLLALLLLISGRGGKRSWSFYWGSSLNISIQFLIALAPAGIAIARMEQLKRETQEAQERAREVRWMSHRGSFSPSLLFSNLKHLADLADHDAPATEQGLVDLAELYRRGLIEAEHPLISLSAERELAEQYLALERGRWGNGLLVRWHLDPDLEHRLLPPLLLLPLFESLLAPGPEAGELALDVFVQADSAFLSLRFQRMQAGPPPSEPALNAMLQRMRVLSGEGGLVELLPKAIGWELLLRIPSLEARP